MPTTYDHYRLPSLMARFVQRHLAVRIELDITNRNVDLVAEGFDLVVWLGDLPDSELVARKLEEAALGLVASPHYLRRQGTPASLESLESLERHACLPFVMPSTGRMAPGC